MERRFQNEYSGYDVTTFLGRLKLSTLFLFSRNVIQQKVYQVARFFRRIMKASWLSWGIPGSSGKAWFPSRLAICVLPQTWRWNALSGKGNKPSLGKARESAQTQRKHRRWNLRGKRQRGESYSSLPWKKDLIRQPFYLLLSFRLKDVANNNHTAINNSFIRIEC